MLVELTPEDESWLFVENVIGAKTLSEVISILKKKKANLEEDRDKSALLAPSIAKAIQEGDMSPSYLSSLDNAKKLNNYANYMEALILMIMGADQKEPHYFESAFTILKSSEDVSPLTKYPMTLICEGGMEKNFDVKKRKYLSALQAGRVMKDTGTPFDSLSLAIFVRVAKEFVRQYKDRDFLIELKKFLSFVTDR